MIDNSQQDDVNRAMDDGPDGDDMEIARSIWAMGGLDAGIESSARAADEDPVQRFKERLKRAARERATHPPDVIEEHAM
jgi:hypothetical protein